KRRPPGRAQIPATQTKTAAGAAAFASSGTDQAAIALTAADRRLLWRAALFLWMIFLSAMLSMVLIDVLNTVCAAALSPPSTALRTALMAVRGRDGRRALWARAVTAWRARLRACAELAMFVLPW